MTLNVISARDLEAISNYMARRNNDFEKPLGSFSPLYILSFANLS